MTRHKRENQTVITRDEITLRFGEMEPIVIPRRSLRTRLQLIEWVYRLTGWPGMNLRRLRTFIAAVLRHHGWGLAEEPDNPRVAGVTVGDERQHEEEYATAACGLASATATLPRDLEEIPD